MRSSTAIGNNKYIGLGKKQREWAGAEIGTPVKGEEQLKLCIGGRVRIISFYFFSKEKEYIGKYT